jgi:phosphoglycolate phosphatase-like HAD superfamily hydrolase
LPERSPADARHTRPDPIVGSSPLSRRLAIFDIDGTLTDTNHVDDECYREALARALELTPAAIDWSGAPHVTDSGIFGWVCEAHQRPSPSVEHMARARSLFVDRLTAVLHEDSARFAAIPGAASALRRAASGGWRLAVATGGWGPSARLKLRAAGLDVPDDVLACSDDAVSRADIVRLARRRAERFYGCAFERVVSVGDGRWDVETALALDLPFIGIGSGTRAAALRAAGAGIVLADYSDLSAFERALESATVPAG